MKSTYQKEPVFSDLQVEDPTNQTTEIESLCVNCGENGVTKLLLTKIPHYKEVILMSFSCDECGFQNNEIQSGGQIQEQGVSYEVKISQTEDLSRQIVKSDYATLIVPQIDLEIPANSQKGAITTIEGVLQRAIAGLLQDQPVRKHMDPDGARQIDQYVARIEGLLSLQKPFHIIIRDPSGNSYVENLRAPKTDPSLKISQFSRSREQDHVLGIYTEDEIVDVAKQDDDISSTTSSTKQCEEGEFVDNKEKVAEETVEATGLLDAPQYKRNVLDEEGLHKEGETATIDENDILRDEVFTFPTNCPECKSPAATNMKVTNIPHFKDVVIMATVCDYCGHKTNEVKSGGGIEPKGKRITLRVTDISDMSRDVLKSETCSLLIPELEFEMGGHALGGRFTTLEGLLTNIIDQVDTNPMLGAMSAIGDSATSDQRLKIDAFKKDVADMIACKKPMTIILDDPAGNSYIQNTYAPEKDPEMQVTMYDRSFEQNDDLGLNDMKTENYEVVTGDANGINAS